MSQKKFKIQKLPNWKSLILSVSLALLELAFSIRMLDLTVFKQFHLGISLPIKKYKLEARNS